VADCRAADCDVIMLYDNSRKDFNPAKVGGNYVLFDTDVLRQMGYRVHEDRPAWYNSDYALLHFYRKNPDYQYYWMIEYDVYFKGCWRLLFDVCEKDDSDLLGTCVASLKEEPQYGWWDEHNLDVQRENQRKVFFPIVRFSHGALKFLDEQYKQGKWGFCEIVGPTLLGTHGYKISDIGGVFYDRKQFRFEPYIPMEATIFLSKNKLYHPVKTSILAKFIKPLLPGGIEKWLRKLSS
jgi:hypothetical protein